jgi:hypothetical protein
MAKQPLLTPATAPGTIGQELFKIAVTWDKQRIIQDLAPDVELELSPAALNKALAEQAGRFAWWGLLAVRARRITSGLEQQLKTRKSELYTEIRAGDVKLTVDGVKSAVDAHADVLALQQQVLQAQEDQEALAVGQEAMRHRKDALITISSNMRAELDAGIVGKSPLEDAKEKAAKVFGKK